MTATLDTIVADVVAGAGPDTVLLMRLLVEAATEAEARAALARASNAAEPAGLARLERLLALWAAHPQAWTLVRSVLDGVAHEPQAAPPEQALQSWAAVFDRLATAAPEAGVALYSLGSPTLLAAATQEIVELMSGLGLLDSTHDALDIGCGIGRMVLALAPHLQTIIGVDIAAGMIAEARRRCAGLTNVRLLQGTGRDLDFVPDASIDTVLAADVFPYLVQVGNGLPARHISDIGRILRPGGGALILNYSYRNDLETDRRELVQFAADAELMVERNGSKDLALWDGTSFLLRKEVAAGA